MRTFFYQICQQLYKLILYFMEGRRPHSCMTTRSMPETPRPHATPPKQYRIPQQEVYNYVRNRVQQTFKPISNRNYQLIKEYTEASGLPSEKSKVQLERLCRKYSILRQNRKPSFFQGAPINVEQITTRYVKCKSKEKQKEEVRGRLKRDINAYYRYGRKSQYQKTDEFFSFRDKQIVSLENREKKKDSERGNSEEHKRKISHPYLQIYQQVQQNTVNSVFSSPKAMKLDPGFSFQEMDEEEKVNENLEEAFKRNSLRTQRKRKVQSSMGKKRSSKPNNNSKQFQFFLT